MATRITAKQKSARRVNIAVARKAKKKGSKRPMSLVEIADALVKKNPALGKSLKSIPKKGKLRAKGLKSSKFAVHLSSKLNKKIKTYNSNVLGKVTIPD